MTIGLSQDEMADMIIDLVEELRCLPPVEEGVPIFSEPIIPLDLTRDTEELKSIIQKSTGVKARGTQNSTSSAKAAPRSRLWQAALRSTHTNREGRAQSHKLITW